jgi:hypothetical protein
MLKKELITCDARYKRYALLILIPVILTIIIILLAVVIKLVVKHYENFEIDDYRLDQPDQKNQLIDPQKIKLCNSPDFPFNPTPHFEVLKDTIFVSVASYRDSECSGTIESLYNNAKYPERIYVGICEQNKAGYTSEICTNGNKNIPLGNIKVHRLDYKQAKGPTYARYFCSKLWSGQEYYFQIDSHTKFEKNWDESLIKMLKECKKTSSKPVLSAYPGTDKQVKSDGIPVMESVSIGKNGLPVFYAGFWTGYKSNEPIKSPKPFVAAGFMFLEASFLYEVQYDPYLSGLFQGEETLFSARLFTNGYDIFAPNIKVCSHHYNRKGPMYYNDMPDFVYCREMAENKVKYLLGLSNSVDVSFLKEMEYYGLGHTRTLDQFWKASGLAVSGGKLIIKT